MLSSLYTFECEWHLICNELKIQEKNNARLIDKILLFTPSNRRGESVGEEKSQGIH